MPDFSPTTDVGSPRWVAASVLSAILHLTAVVLIVAAIDSSPQGAGNFDSGEIGIVLGDDSPGQDDAGGPAAAPPPVTPVAVAEVIPPDTPVVAPTATAAAPPTQTIAPQTTPRVAQAQPQGQSGGTGNSSGYGPPGDGQANVRVFGVEGKGSRFVYVFDRSSSMEGAPLATAKQQLIQSLSSLSNLHQFHVIFFNQQIRNFDLSGGGRRIAFATDRNKKLAERFVGGITADGGTDRLPALRAAVQMNPDVIFFLTDADEPMSRSELEEITELNRRSGVMISTIEFGRGPAKQAKNFLTELARLTGGQYGYVDTTKLGR
jgi:hypothetical protein